MKNALLMVGIGAIIVGGGWYFASRNTLTTKNSNSGAAQEVMPSADTPAPARQAPGASIGDENLVQFSCSDGKSLTAVFTRDIVGLTLSDGRQMELRQAVSGSGIRYVNANESIELRGKGDDASLIEGGVTTFADCAAQ